MYGQASVDTVPQLSPAMAVGPVSTATGRPAVTLARTQAAWTGSAVAAFQSVALTLLPRAITALAERHPGIVVHLTEAEPEQALPALVARDFDLVVAEEYPNNRQPPVHGIDTENLLAEPIRLAHPPTVCTPAPRRR